MKDEDQRATDDYWEPPTLVEPPTSMADLIASQQRVSAKPSKPCCVRCRDEYTEPYEFLCVSCKEKPLKSQANKEAFT